MRKSLISFNSSKVKLVIYLFQLPSNLMEQKLKSSSLLQDPSGNVLSYPHKHI